MKSWISHKPPGIRNKKSAGSVLLLMLVLLSLHCTLVQAQTINKPEDPKTETQKTETQKTEVQKTENQKTENTKAETKPGSNKTESPETDTPKTDIDWGDWDTEFPDAQTDNNFGVGIQGQIEAEISRIDKSNLLQNPTGVATKEKASNTEISKKTKDLKKAMAELEAMEAKVKKEIEDDSEF